MLVLWSLGLLLVLWAFIVWERRRPMAPISRDAQARGWSPRALVRWPSFAGIAAVAGVLGAAQWSSPSHPPFDGRLSWVFQWTYAQFGPAGPAYFWWAVAAVFASLSVGAWRAATGRAGDAS